MSYSVYNRHFAYPKDCVYIGRGTPWGNPFFDGSRESNCNRFEKWVYTVPGLVDAIKKELKGKNLLCSCKPLRCHGDFLLKLANANDIDDLFGENYA